MGTTHHDGLSIKNDAAIGGNLNVTGTATLGSLAVGGDLSGTAANAIVAKINGVALGTTTATNGNVLFANGTSWGTATPDTAGLVAKSGNQTIAGEKTFSDDCAFSADVDIAYADITRLEYKGFRQVYDFDEGANALASTVIAKALFTGGGTSGTQAIIAGVGGVMQLDTGATGSQSSTLALTNASMIKTSQKPVFSALVKTDALTHRKILVGLYKDANNYVMFEFDTDNVSDAGNWKLVSNNAGAGEVETDTGVAAAAAYTELSIELAADGSIEAEIDGTDVAAAHAGDAADDVYTLYAYIDNKAEAQSNKLDIDYFIIEQER